MKKPDLMQKSSEGAFRSTGSTSHLVPTHMTVLEALEITGSEEERAILVAAEASSERDVVLLAHSVRTEKFDVTTAQALSQGGPQLVPKLAAILAIGSFLSLDTEKLLTKAQQLYDESPEITPHNMQQRLLRYLIDEKPFGVFIAELAQDLLGD